MKLKKINRLIVCKFVSTPKVEEKIFERTLVFQSKAAMKKAYLNMYETYSLMAGVGYETGDFGKSELREYALENLGRMMIFESKENGVQYTIQVYMHYYDLKGETEPVF